MITYEKYTEFRDAKNLKDADVARRAGIQQSIFSDWKKGKSKPKVENMIKISDALEMDYRDFMGPVGKYSSYNLNKPEPHKPTERELHDKELLKKYHDASPEIRDLIDHALKLHQQKP